MSCLEKTQLLVAGVTKLSKLKFHSKEEAQADNYRRLFLAMADDFRGLLLNWLIDYII